MSQSIQISSEKVGFTLIEVVLALGVFLVSVLALIGLLAPMLQSIDEIEKIDEITSVVNTVSAFIQGSPKIAAVNSTKFDTIYNAIYNNGYVTIFVFRKYIEVDQGDGETLLDAMLEVGFSEDDDSGSDLGPDAYINNFDEAAQDAAGPIYRIVLSASSVTPAALRSYDSALEIYTLESALADYTEGYLALEARIFAEDPPGPDGDFNGEKDLSDLAATEPDFTFNIAIVR